MQLHSESFPTTKTCRASLDLTKEIKHFQAKQLGEWTGSCHLNSLSYTLPEEPWEWQITCPDIPQITKVR